MPSHKLLFPDDVRALVARQYARHQKDWLARSSSSATEYGATQDGVAAAGSTQDGSVQAGSAGNGFAEDGAIAVELGCPSEKQAAVDSTLIQNWIISWQKWSGGGQLIWQEKRWRQLGTQKLPSKLIFDSPSSIATWLGEGQRWQRACARYAILVRRWPTANRVLSDLFEILADYEEIDFERLQAVTQWLVENPASMLFPRQIPVAGVDSKWFEKRRQIVQKLVWSIITDSMAAAETRQSLDLGLKGPPDTFRMKILDRDLRAQIGDLTDIAAPIEDLFHMPIRPKFVFIVENLQTFLAFEKLSSSIVLLGMGYKIERACSIPWLKLARCYYWGDIDTHGLAILDMARAVLPDVKSILMDQETFLSHKDLWSTEESQASSIELKNLTNEESALYRGLKEQAWGTNMRLEQERINWTEAWKQVLDIVDEGP
jgi:hypothetical protein